MKKPKTKRSLQTQALCAIIAAGCVPAVIVAAAAHRGRARLNDALIEKFHQVTIDPAGKVERKLFERYGDVQAFGLNEVVYQRDSCDQVGSEKNEIAAAANAYAKLYGIDPPSMLVDLEGRVRAGIHQSMAGQFS